MSSLLTGVVVFACVFGGAMLGLVLRGILPPHHRDAESRDLVKMGMGFVGTMSALLLGLLVASTKASYDTQKNEVTDLSAKLVVLDRTLAHFGPETDKIREELRHGVERLIDQTWPADPTRTAQLDPTTTRAEGLYEAMMSLNPSNETQRSLKAQAVATSVEIGKLRWQLFEQSGSSISKPLIVMVVSWLAIIFIGYGYCSPRNATVIVTLLVCALSVTSALFLIMEMDRPFSGLIHIPSDAIRGALSHLGKPV